MESKVKKKTLEKGGVFIPVISLPLLSKIESSPLPQFFEDPTKIVKAISALHSYYRCKGVTCYCDLTLEAEALGCELYASKTKNHPPVDDDLKSRAERIALLGRIPTALEVIKRLKVILRDVILMATITGPLTLAKHLGALDSDQPNREILNLATKATLNLTRSYGEAGLDILLFREEEFSVHISDMKRIIKNSYTPIWNTAKFYEMRPALLDTDIRRENIPSFCEVADCLITGNPNTLTEISIEKTGYAMPFLSLADPPTAIRSRLERDLPAEQLKSGKIMLVTTADEIPSNIDKEALINGIETVQNYIDAIL